MQGAETGLEPEPELVHAHELVPGLALEPEPVPEPEPEPAPVLEPVPELALVPELAPGPGLVTEQPVGHRVADGHHLVIGFLPDAVQIVDASPALPPVVASLRDLAVASTTTTNT